MSNEGTATTTAASAIPWHPDRTSFPTRKELPKIAGAPDEAAWVWGKDDNIGRLNLLTPSRVAAAAASEIKLGEIIPVNLPLQLPSPPAFGREPFRHTIKPIADGSCYDDLYELNTQSGTQWDGFRHFPHLATGSFYNGCTAADILGPAANVDRCGIHHLAAHGIAGRGVLLDYRGYARAQGRDYDPFDRHPITYADLVACGRAQGLDIRPEAQGGDIKVGDILLVRSGWTEAYHALTATEQDAFARRAYAIPGGGALRYAGLEQEECILDWLHDSYFAAVGGDSPTFEAWPTEKPYYLHESILALWGMPLGEMLDLERLADRCANLGRWTFFFTSVPDHCLGGVGAHVNGQVIL